MFTHSGSVLRPAEECEVMQSAFLCVCLSLSVCPLACRKNDIPNLTKLSLRVIRDRGPVLFWRQWNILWTQNGSVWRSELLIATRQVAPLNFAAAEAKSAVLDVALFQDKRLKTRIPQWVWPRSFTRLDQRTSLRRDLHIDALTLWVGWQEGRPAYETVTSCTRRLSLETSGWRKSKDNRSSRSSGQWLLKSYVCVEISQ